MRADGMSLAFFQTDTHQIGAQIAAKPAI